MRVAMAVGFLLTGVGHFVAHEQLLQLVPRWVPARSALIWLTGAMELGLAAGLLGPRRHRPLVGWAAAGFLLAVFPANVHQAVAGIDVGPLDSDLARWGRLALQPLLILAALWSTGAIGVPRPPDHDPSTQGRGPGGGSHA